MTGNIGITCPICKKGTVTLIPETLQDEIPQNQCNRCGVVFTFIIEDDGEEYAY